MKKEKYIYISCPILISQAELTTILSTIIKKTSCHVKHWGRKSSYDQLMVNNAKAIVIVHPYNRFEFSINSLPAGVLNEFKRAKSSNIPIYLAYKNVGGEYNTYEIGFDTGENIMCGIPGTTTSLFEYMNNKNDSSIAGKIEEYYMADITTSKINEKTSEKTTDKRLLLLI